MPLSYLINVWCMYLKRNNEEILKDGYITSGYKFPLLLFSSSPPFPIVDVDVLMTGEAAMPGSGGLAVNCGSCQRMHWFHSWHKCPLLLNSLVVVLHVQLLEWAFLHEIHLSYGCGALQGLLRCSYTRALEVTLFGHCYWHLFLVTELTEVVAPLFLFAILRPHLTLLKVYF